MWHWHASENRNALGNYLAQSLHSYGDPSSETWVELARIYRDSGHRAEYEVLAGRLLETWNIRLPDWSETQHS